MGVRGLFALINDNQSVLLTDYKLHDTKLIIDGSTLYHCLYHFYNVREEFSGDYNHYANGIRKFFRRLRACNVQPYVVIDGCYNPDDRKLHNVLRCMAERRERAAVISEGRREDMNEIVHPVLANETFRQVLTEIGVPHVSCLYEAVREIATLAARWRCPVLSNNSDYFIYRLEGGVLPFSNRDNRFINMELMIYDKATDKSRKHIVLDESENIEVAPDDYLYIEAKLYSYKRILERVQGPPEFLPMFATFSGNDYVDRSQLKDFYRKVCIQRYKDKPLNLRAKLRKASVIHWAMAVTSDEDALKEALPYVEDKPPISRSMFRNAVLNSLSSYRDLGQFTDLDLEAFFKQYNPEKTCSIDASIKLKKLPDHVTKLAMPRWSSEMLRSCKMAGSFVQNAAVNHRVIFDCQIEILDQPSSYVCSRYIRSVVYAIATTFKGQKKKTSKRVVDTLVDTGGSRNSCIEESDRKKKDREKVYVKPTLTVMFGSKSLDVPSLENVPEMHEKQRMEIVFATLGLTPEVVEMLGGADDPVPVFVMGVLSFWFRNADPAVSPNLVIAVIIGIVRLHFIAVETEEGRLKLNLIQPLARTIYRQYNEGPPKSNEIFKVGESESWGSTERLVVHGLTQLQACYLNATYLNNALMTPINLPCIGDLFNCTFICNMCKTLDGFEDHNAYLAGLFNADSPLYTLVTRWCDVTTSSPVNDVAAASSDGKAASGKGKRNSMHFGKHRK